MRLLLASAIAFAALAAPASAETRSYNITGFKKIEASAGFKIEFTQSSTWSVVVDSRYNNLDKITIEKVGDTLRIVRPKNTRIQNEVEDIVRISAPDLDALDLNAAIKFTATRLNVDDLAIDADAAISIEIGELRVDQLDVNIDAASKIALAGTCNRLNVVLGAASKVEAKDLRCREANISAGVASSVHAYASEKAVAKAGMSSSITVSGRPRDFQKESARFGSSVSLAD